MGAVCRLAADFCRLLYVFWFYSFVVDFKELFLSCSWFMMTFLLHSSGLFKTNVVENVGIFLPRLHQKNSV